MDLTNLMWMKLKTYIMMLAGRLYWPCKKGGRIKERKRKDTPKYGRREEWTKQTIGIRRVFRKSRIRSRQLWWRFSKKTRR